MEDASDAFDLETRQQQSHQALLRQLKQELREKSPPMTAICVEVGYGDKTSPRKRKILSSVVQPKST